MDKLLRLGDGWLNDHPERDRIVRRYLKFGHLVRSAIGQVAGTPDGDGLLQAGEPHVRPTSLQEARIEAAVNRLAEAGARRVADLGCGEGDLVAAILDDRRFDGVIGVDPSPTALQKAAKRLRLDGMQLARQSRVTLVQGAATYPDSRLSSCDVYAMLEVIEHIDPWRLPAMEEVVFGSGGPRTVVLTTPNREWNATIPSLADGSLRHGDHRFEFTRQECLNWADGVASRRGHRHEWFGVGGEMPGVGPATQGLVFTRSESNPTDWS